MKSSATALRAELEAALSHRIPGALTPRIRQAPELFPTGVESIDNILSGGIPRGGVTEISGSASTGRTTLALSILAQATQRGAACSWVDVHDAFDPVSAADSGVLLERTLWLRCGGRESVPVEDHFQVKAIPQQNTYPLHGHTQGQHPRAEVRGFDRAVSELFRSEARPLGKSAGTPGAINRQFFTPRCSEPLPHRRKEQLATGSLTPPRSEAMLPSRKAVSILANGASAAAASRFTKPWPRLEQAIRATDLLLQAGGFGAIVVDMSEVKARDAMRIPTATWYRFRLAAEQSQAAVVLLTQTPCARSCASIVLCCERAKEAEQWSANAGTALFEGIAFKLILERKRGEDVVDPFRKKHVHRVQATWNTRAQRVR
jgi:recombination protein RecA